MTRIATRTIGAAEVTILTDGGIDFGTELFPGTLPDHIADLMQRQKAASIATNFNAVLIREGGRTVLCDAGPRDLFGPTCGDLPLAMAEAGLDPAQVDTLFATHLHPDHIAGMITAQGAAVFPNAELVVTRAEHAFWSEEAATGAMPDPIPDWSALARAVLAAYGSRLRLIDPQDQIAPGLTAMPLAGHTPGHSGWRLSSGTAQLIHGGDIIHADPEYDMGITGALKIAHFCQALGLDVQYHACGPAHRAVISDVSPSHTVKLSESFTVPSRYSGKPPKNASN